MKWIKSYKLFESKFEDDFKEQYERIKPEIKDILLPIEDTIGYSIYDYIDDNIGEITFEIQNVTQTFNLLTVRQLLDSTLNVTKKFFNWSEIKDEISHLSSFMKSEDMNISLVEIQQFIDGEFKNNSFYDGSELDEFEDNLRLTKFEITFCKTN